MAKHSQKQIQKAATLFFRLRGLVRSRLAAGKRLDPYAWLRIETMVYIRDHEGPRPSDIAEYLAITAPSASSLLKLLTREGLIVLRRHDIDRRAHRVYLSRKGEKLLAQTTKRGIRIVGGVFAPLTSQELNSFIHDLERMLG